MVNMKPRTPVRIYRACHWLASCLLLGLAHPHPLPCWPFFPLFGACLLLFSRGLQGKEKWLQGSQALAVSTD